MSPRAVAGLAVVVGNDHEFAQLQAASVPRRHDSLASRPENPARLAGLYQLATGALTHRRQRRASVIEAERVTKIYDVAITIVIP